MPVYRLDDRLLFPNPRLAGEEGLLAVGGDLRPERLLLAYENGIFPWFNAGEPPLWWSPDPRYVLFPDQLNVSKSMRTLLRQKAFRVTCDLNFPAVIRACAQPSLGRNESGTWITTEMEEAYIELHRIGYAHSVEVWHEKLLVGGLYGISMGQVFFGESMFTRQPNASKYGFIHLVNQLAAWRFQLIDCQQGTRHLISLGAVPMPREKFLQVLHDQDHTLTKRGLWVFDHRHSG
ncbi:MAG: leucyl/phenylalanyl-tRNA--protein transferase [Saprospiraceae bacterium]|nr:leucyl/phenylalanyl-tRNA--protein transferase [Saprospiraceae bacterium]